MSEAKLNESTCYRVKRFLANRYYDTLMLLEDFFSDISTKINEHRKTVDDKWWDKYLSDNAGGDAHGNR